MDDIIINIELSLNEMDLIIKSLLELPAKQSIILINKLQAIGEKEINTIKE